MRKHTHRTFEIITEYFSQAPAQVRNARCLDCKEENEALRQIMQDREDATYRLYGNRSPVVLAKGIKSVGKRALVDANHPGIKEVIDK